MSEDLLTTVSYADKRVAIQRGTPTVVIGERINPTGRKRMQHALLNDDFDLVRQDARSQVASGAAILDINAGIPGADESRLLRKVVEEVMAVVQVPLCIDTADPSALSAALQIYDGKALVNSVNAERNSMETVLPLVGEHGAAVIALCLDENGIPESPEQRLAVAGKIIERAAEYGIPAQDVIIDPLVLSVGANAKAGWVALRTTELLVKEFGVNVTMGVSNISFGLPARARLNATFLAMAIKAGVTCPITNPLSEEIIDTIRAADLAMGRDEYAASWIRAYRRKGKQKNR